MAEARSRIVPPPVERLSGSHHGGNRGSRRRHGRHRHGAGAAGAGARLHCHRSLPAGLGNELRKRRHHPRGSGRALCAADEPAGAVRDGARLRECPRHSLAVASRTGTRALPLLAVVSARCSAPDHPALAPTGGRSRARTRRAHRGLGGGRPHPQGRLLAGPRHGKRPRRRGSRRGTQARATRRRLLGCRPSGTCARRTCPAALAGRRHPLDGALDLPFSRAAGRRLCEAV